MEESIDYLVCGTSSLNNNSIYESTFNKFNEFI